ncbi:MAG: EAL domain-containing protein [Gaiellales bacterium]
MARTAGPPRTWWRSIALLSGGLFFLGAAVSLLAALSVSLGGAHHRVAYIVLALGYVAVGTWLVAVRRPVSMPALHAVGVAGITGLSIGVALDDPVWTTYVPFYAWMAAVFALLASTRGLAVMLLEIVVGFSIALAFHPSAGDVAAAGSWVLVIIGLSVFIHSVRSLIGRSLRRERDQQVERYHSLLQTLPGVVYRCRPDRDRTFELLGPGALELTGHTSDELLARRPPFMSLVNPEDAEAAFVAMQDALAHDEPFQTTYRLTRKDDGEVWVEDWSRPTHGPDGLMLEGILFDVTQEVTERAQADAVREEYRTLVETIPLVTYTNSLDIDSPSLYTSPQLEKLLGYGVEEWENGTTRWVDLLHPDDRERAINENREHVETGRPFRLEYRLRTKDGGWRWFLDEAVIVRDAGGHPVSSRGFMVDITQQKELEHRLAHEAFHDSLTGLANRALFHDRVEHALSRRSRTDVAVIYVDLDDFKTVNDSLGHGIGDDVIRTAAERLRHTVRRSDTLARLGGDEFAILVEDDPSHGERVAAAVLGAFDLPIVAAGRQFDIRASVGLARSEPNSDAESLIRRADLAMYAAKARGKGRLEVYTEALGGRARDRLEIRSDLRNALKTDQLRMFFQPIVNLADGGTVGAEALLRWEHPTKGWVPPMDFIPIAEEAGLLVELGRSAISKAVVAAAGLRNELEIPGFFVSVNLSPRELLEDDLVDFVDDLTRRHGFPADSLVLEMTESLMLSDPELAIQRLHRLRSLGFRVALDDFGTGYSSLSYLGRMPVDILKIAKPFVDALGTGSREAHLLAALIPLAHDLGLAVVAEGIERPLQTVELVGLGCRLGQGFMYAPPVPAEELVLTHRFAPLRERREGEMLERDLSLRAGTASTARRGRRREAR